MHRTAAAAALVARTVAAAAALTAAAAAAALTPALTADAAAVAVSVALTAAVAISIAVLGALVTAGASRAVAVAIPVSVALVAAATVTGVVRLKRSRRQGRRGAAVGWRPAGRHRGDEYHASQRRQQAGDADQLAARNSGSPSLNEAEYLDGAVGIRLFLVYRRSYE